MSATTFWVVADAGNKVITSNLAPTEAGAWRLILQRERRWFHPSPTRALMEAEGYRAVRCQLLIVGEDD